MNYLVISFTMSNYEIYLQYFNMTSNILKQLLHEKYFAHHHCELKKGTIRLDRLDLFTF